MRVRVLGPLEVENEGRVLVIGSPQLRLLLARLAVDAGRVVSTDTLAYELLGDSDDARRSVKTYVSRLRRELGTFGAEDALRTVPPGYRLEVSPADVDAVVFEQHVRAGSPHHALVLWRGQPYADVTDREFVRLERIRLEALRIAALESSTEAEIAAGRHTAAVADLEVLTREHPLHERFWMLLMTALYRSGRQADALRTFQAARRLLVEELGVEPGAELRALESAIIRQDPALSYVTPDPQPAAGDVNAVPVLLVDDHPLWRETVRTVLSRSGRASVVGEAGTAAEAVELAATTGASVVLMDLELPDATGADATREIVERAPATRVLMLTASHDAADAVAAVRAGAVGYVVKTASSSELLDAVERASQGQPVFTGSLAEVVLRELRNDGGTPSAEDRDRSVLAMMAGGWEPDRVARELGVTVDDISTSLRNVLRRMQAVQ